VCVSVLNVSVVKYMASPVELGVGNCRPECSTEAGEFMTMWWCVIIIWCGSTMMSDVYCGRWSRSLVSLRTAPMRARRYCRWCSRSQPTTIAGMLWLCCRCRLCNNIQGTQQFRLFVLMQCLITRHVYFCLADTSYRWTVYVKNWRHCTSAELVCVMRCACNSLTSDF